jgi:hypothetical protein
VPPIQDKANAPAVPARITPSLRQYDGFIADVPLCAPADPIPVDLRTGPWIDTPEAALFWQGLQDRLYRYLGRMTATESNGYRVVVAISPGEEAEVTSAISQFAHSAGLQDIDVIRATDALMSRFIASPTGSRTAATATSAGPPLVAVAVALGDVAAEVTVYHLSPPGATDNAPIFRADRIDALFALLPYGSAHWERQLLQRVGEHLREPLPPNQEFLLQDAAREFGAALRRTVRYDTILDWNGPFCARMHSPLRLRTEDCLRDWPEARKLVEELPERIREAAHVAGVEDGVPDILLLGGVGARWPFAFQAVEQLLEGGTAQKLQIWSSNTAEEDVARGASWWPEMCAETLPVLQDDLSDLASAPKSTGPKRVMPAGKSAVRPRKSDPVVTSVTDATDATDAAVPPSLRQLDF